VGCRNNRLLYGVTVCPTQAASSLVPCVKVIIGGSAIDSLLSEFPDPSRPTGVQSEVCPCTVNHIRTTPGPPVTFRATSIGTEPAHYRQSRVRLHVAGRHRSSIREYLVVCPTHRSQVGQRLATLQRLQTARRTHHSRPLSRQSYPLLLSRAFRLFGLLQNQSGGSIQPNTHQSR
jgi:hypothetical protein